MAEKEPNLLQTVREARLLAEIQEQLRKQKAGGARWSRDEQRARLPVLLEMRDKGTFFEREAEEILAEVFPLTSNGALAALFKDIHWETSKTGTPEDIADILKLTEAEDASLYCIRLRAPGGEVVPLSPEKAAVKWEAVLENWLKEKSDLSELEHITQLGERIANSYRIQKHHVLKDVGDTDQYIATYHFESLVPGHEHKAHCCGAHGNDTHRAIMSAYVQAALVVWATDGQKQVLVKGRRTLTNHDKSLLLTPPARYDKFLAAHFSQGRISPDPEAKLAAGGSFYGGNSRPALKSVHDAIVKLHKATPRTTKRGAEIKKVLLSCSDDRVGVRIDEKGGIRVSDVPEHVSNAMHVSIGGRANLILNNQVEPPAVYRSTLIAGITNISVDDLGFAKEQLLHDVPLIVKQVMSPDDMTKYILVDVVVGMEPPDPVESNNPDPVKRFHPDTVKILTNPDILKNAGIDKSIIDAITRDPRNIVDLNDLERRECIKVHEVLVFAGLDRAIVGQSTRENPTLQGALKAETEQEYRADQRRFGQPRNLYLYLRVMRGAKKTIESRRLIIHSGA